MWREEIGAWNQKQNVKIENSKNPNVIKKTVIVIVFNMVVWYNLDIQLEEGGLLYEQTTNIERIDEAFKK